MYLDVAKKQEFFFRTFESFLSSAYVGLNVCELQSRDFVNECMPYQAMKDTLGNYIVKMAKPFEDPFDSKVVNSTSGYFILLFCNILLNCLSAHFKVMPICINVIRT